jgi:hypothetical protein
MQAVRFVAEHAPHAPDAWQACPAAEPAQSPSAAQPRQTWLVPSHTGEAPAQVALVTHPMHTPRGTSQTAVAPWHVVAFVAEHAPHAPVGWQAGVAGVAAQSVSPAQPRQVFVPVSQTGFAPPHWPGVVQEEHVPVATSHPATGPVHFVVFDPEQTPHAPLGWQAGVAGVPAQSASLAQAWQTWLVPLQTGVVPAHWALVRHPTQVPAAASHTDVAPEHFVLFVAEHAPHDPFGWQAGVAGVAVQSASLAQPWQARAVPSHTGVVPAQSERVRHPTHVAVVTSQMGVAPAHAVLFVAEHAPQAPLDWHAGVAAPHWESLPQGWQVCVAPSHTGLEPAQSAFATQATHVPVPVAQTGVAPVHCVTLVAEHSPHAPDGSQAGLTPLHSPSPAHARQVLVVASQIGVEPLHWAAVRQPTHDPVTTLQAGLAPTHWVAFVAEHAPHAPFGWQAGVAPPQSASVAQARHACVVVLQVGVVPAQLELVTHATHVAVPMSQAGVVPEQSDAFVAEQTPHAPPGWQAGVPPPQSASTAQARQVCEVPSQVGVAPEQSTFTMQETQVAVAGLHTGVAPVHSVAFVAEHVPHAPDGSQAGVPPLQSPSAAQPRQVCVATLQMGVVPEQVAFATQATHVPAVTSQAGVAPVHFEAFVAEHAPQAPFAWQAGVAPPHSPSPAQGRQAWSAWLQTGVVPEQSALPTQPTQPPVATLHTGVVPVHFEALVAEQAPQPPVGWQAGVAPPHSRSPEQGRQVCVPRLQTGALPPQSEFDTHATQVPAEVRQTGVAPPQAVVLVAEHWPHAPVGSQAGVAGFPPHSPSPWQPRQTCSATLQTGEVKPQSVSPRQRTHRPVAVLQTGVAPVHAEVFVAEHWPHAPEASQAGVAPPHSPSPAHPRHVWVPPLQTGAVPEQLAFETHPTHVWLVVLQTGVAPVQAEAFVAEHWPHAPLGSQAGVVPPHSPSPAHWRQTCEPVLQIGVAPPHWAFDRHEAHVPVGTLQTGVAPVHCVLFDAEHTPHEPLGWQAGVPPEQSTSPAQARHWPVPVLQTGVVLPQAAVFVAEHWPQDPFDWQAGVALPHCESLAHPWHR